MAGEEAAQPVGAASLAEAHEGLLELDRALRIVAGLRHVLHAVGIGFEFRAATVTSETRLRQQVGAAHDETAVVAVAGSNSGADHADLQNHGACLLLRGVARRSVHGLVPEHCSKLRLGFEFVKQPAVNGNLPSRERPSIGHRVVQHDKLVRQVDAALRGDALANALHVSRQFGIQVVSAALRLLHRRIVLPAQLDLLRRIHENKLAFARNRVDRAARGEQETEQQENTEFAHGDTSLVRRGKLYRLIHWPYK